jgi:hypothetical protein
MLFRIRKMWLTFYCAMQRVALLFWHFEVIGDNKAHVGLAHICENCFGIVVDVPGRAIFETASQIPPPCLFSPDLSPIITRPQWRIY